MKWSFLLFSSFLCLQAIAQYPATGNKMRLGWQTTGDGLVYRGAIGDTATLDPSGINNAWMLLDTANGNLYAYRAKAWRLVSGGGGSVSDTLTGEVKGPLDSTYIDTVANIIFRLDSTTVGVGELKYNDTQGSLIQGLKGGNVTNVIGQQIHQRVTNTTGAPLTKGTAVFLHGSQGNRITVRKALATVDSTSANTFGIVAESIANNQSGYVITEGLITNMNTNALTEGAAVYLSPTVAGELTTTKPQAPQHTVYIGVCVKQNAGSGELFVKIRNGQELDELHDVRIDSLASNASLYYNTAQGVWRDTTAAVLVADTTAMLSPYLKKQDTLSLSNRINLKLNISDTSVFARDFQISGTAGQVAYFNAANAVTSDTAFRWSAANKTLGINTSTTSGANIIIKNSQEPSRSTVVATQTFAADTTNWTRGTGWTFNGTAAVATAATGDLTYTPALTITSGNAYEVTYTISGYSAGTLTARVGDATYALPTHNATNNAVLLLPTSATGGFRFTTSTFTGNLDNVSVVEVSNPAPVLLAGQDDNGATLYNSMIMPNSTTLSIGAGGRYTTGASNYFLNTSAGRNNTTGNNNYFIGTSAGQLTTSGANNYFFGRNAGQNNTTGSFNFLFGEQAGLQLTTGTGNLAFGYQSGLGVKNGRDNVMIGYESGYNINNGFENVFLGYRAGFYSNGGGYNVHIGSEAGYGDSSNGLGGYNVFIGSRAGYANTSGNFNIAIGRQALSSNTTAGQNVIIGYQAGLANTTGEGNLFLGFQTGYNNTTGNNNIIFGNQSGYNTTQSLTGSTNVIIGHNTARNIFSTASANVAIGNTVNLPTSNGSNQGVYQNVLFFTGASGTGTTIAAGSRAGIKTNAPASDFHVAGEVRIDDLKPTGAPRNIVGSSSTGDLSTMAWGNGLTVSVGDTTLRVDTSLILPKVNVSGTTNYIPKFTGANTVGNSQLFDNGTNISLGSTNPISNGANSRWLTLYGSTGYSGGIVYSVADTARAYHYLNADAGGKHLRHYANIGYGQTFFTNGSGTARMTISAAGDVTIPNAAYMATNSASNVGIGTESTTYKLDLNDQRQGGGITGMRISTYYYPGILFESALRSNNGKVILNDFANGYGTGSLQSAMILQSPGAVQFSTGGDNIRTTIDASGNVGIATSSPSRPLHVAGTTAIRIPVGNFAQRGTSGAGDIRVRNDTANLEFHNGTSWQTVINNADTSVFARDVQISGTANYLPKFTGSNAVGNSVMFEDALGDIGVGTTDPSSFGNYRFIENTGRSLVNGGVFQTTNSDKTLIGQFYTADGQARLATNTNHRLAIWTNNTQRMLFDTVGNVGINTTTPSRRLHVEGETRISDLTTDPATRIVGADADGDLDAITIGNGVTFSSDTLKADTSVLATKTYVTDNAISTVYIPINLYAPGDTVANTTTSKAFFMVHSGLNGYCIDSYTVKAFSGSGTADIQIDKNGTGGNLQAISGTTTATKDTNIALATGDYIRGQVFNLSGTLVGLGLTLEIKKTCN